MTNYLRHGDLLFKEIDVLPTGVKPLDTDIVAFGEATGHHHKLVGGQAIVYESKDSSDKRYVEVKQTSQLTHQEHKTIEVKPAVYEIVNEQEYEPFKEAIQRVAD